MREVAPDSLGFCDPPISSFDDVTVIEGVTGRETHMNHDGVTKTLHGSARIVQGSEIATTAIMGSGGGLSIYDAAKVFPKNVMVEVRKAVQRDLKQRRDNIGG